MKKSIYYVTSCTTIETKSLKVQEPSASNDFNNKYDSAVMCAKYLLEHLENNAIKEVWNVSCVTNYLKRIHEQEEELIRAQEAWDNVLVNNFNVQQTQNAIDKENIELSIKFKNPCKVAVRGRSKSASHCNQASDNVHNEKNVIIIVKYAKDQVIIQQHAQKKQILLILTILKLK
ncbi:hypothetical protein C2G38_2044143 [Gigaspora rosea]|uniref:Uncharacterized protein n=1 Tax=Gigaspora rosea TaxID=44941 RepID=A0A397UHR0_9GLOM|nr:hypothetical protein C2G38_2044143 [Gigaspora rosea]